MRLFVMAVCAYFENKEFWSNISNTKDRVWPHFQTPRRELKVRCAAEYFWRTSRCLGCLVSSLSNSQRSSLWLRLASYHTRQVFVHSLCFFPLLTLPLCFFFIGFTLIFYLVFTGYHFTFPLKFSFQCDWCLGSLQLWGWGPCGWVAGSACHVGGLGLWGWGYRASVEFVFPGHVTSTCDKCG